jgi:hypothetical protein
MKLTTRIALVAGFAAVSSQANAVSLTMNPRIGLAASGTPTLTDSNVTPYIPPSPQGQQIVEWRMWPQLDATGVNYGGSIGAYTTGVQQNNNALVPASLCSFDYQGRFAFRSGTAQCGPASGGVGCSNATFPSSVAVPSGGTLEAQIRIASDPNNGGYAYLGRLTVTH